MAEYPGVLWDSTEWGVSEPRSGSLMYSDNGLKFYAGWFISTAVKHSGVYSIGLFPGGCYDVDYGCLSQTTSISVYMYAPKNGSMRMMLVDPDSGSVVAYADTASEKEWEQVTLSVTTQKKVYILRMMHMGQTLQVQDEPIYGYWDDLV